MNRCVFTGRITKDVELKKTNNGLPYVMFTLAVDRGFKDANGNRLCDFIPCVAWRQQAEFLAQFIKKGYMLAVEGQFQTRSYVNNNNQNIYVYEIICDRVENLQPKETQEQPKPTNKEFEVDPNDLPFELPF